MMGFKVLFGRILGHRYIRMVPGLVQGYYIRNKEPYNYHYFS